jgi:hypothetical protein
MARRFNPYLINRSADYLSKSIQGAVTAFDTQMANIEKSKNELTLQDAELKRISSSLSADDEQNFKDDLTNAVNAEIDRIYKLGYNSIGRDQTEYLKAQSNLLNGVKDLQAGLAIFDEEGKEYQKIVESGQGQFKISNSTDPKARDFMNNISLNKGNGTKIGYENGNFTLNYNGYSKNISNYFQARKNGAAGTISYVGDPSAEYKAIYDKYASNYEPKLIKIQTEAADGTVTTTTRKNYDLARKKIREDLYNDPNLLTSISGDEYQYLSQFSNNIDPNEPFKGTPDQIQKALDAKVNLIMDQYAKENQTTLFMQQQDSDDAKKGDYTRIFRDEANTALNILQSDSPLDSYAQYLRDQNPGQADIYQVKGDTLYRTDIKGNPPKTFLIPVIKEDALEANNANLDKLIIQINENKSTDLMIPQVRMTEYLNTLDINLDAVEEEGGSVDALTGDTTPTQAQTFSRESLKYAVEQYAKETNQPGLVFEKMTESQKQEMRKSTIFREALKEIKQKQQQELNKNQGIPR